MKQLKDNWLLYLLIIVGIAIIYLKPNNDWKEAKNDLKQARDSTFTIHHEREVIKEKTKTNITNILNEVTPQTQYYTKNDSTRIRFIDSFLVAKGKR